LLTILYDTVSNRGFTRYRYSAPL